MNAVIESKQTDAVISRSASVTAGAGDGDVAGAGAFNGSGAESAVQIDARA